MKERPEEDGAPRKGMDPLKAYCLVLGFLVLVLAFLWIKLGGDRSDYEAANLRAEQLLTGKGLVKREGAPPAAIPDLAYEVEQFVETYKQSAGEGGTISGIPLEMMKNYASAVGMKQVNAPPAALDPNKSGGYETRYQTFDYDSTTLERLLKLVYNVESKGRYRVSDILWRLGDAKENAAPPWWVVSKPQIKVAVRTPIQRER